MRDKDSFNITAAVCAAISLLLLIFPSTGLVHAARAVLTYSLYPSVYAGGKAQFFLRGVPENFRQILSAAQKNSELSEKVRNLEMEIESLKAAVSENERLAEEMKISRSLSWKGKWARVLSRDSRNWNGFLTIDKGSSDGIYVNDTVVAMNNGKAALAGRIYETYPHFSRVMLTGNTAFSVIVSLGKNGREVLAEGNGYSGMKIEYIPFDLQLEDGTEVFSAPSATLYIPNMRIGRLSKFYKRDSDVSFFSAEIILDADADSYKELYVIRHEVPDDLVPPAEEGQL